MRLWRRLAPELHKGACSRAIHYDLGMAPYTLNLRAAVLAILLALGVVFFALPAQANAAATCSAQSQGAAHASDKAKGLATCRTSPNGFVHDLAADTLTVNYDRLSEATLFSVTMRIPGYEEYTSGVWVGANVWKPTSQNCLDMAPWCNYGMGVTWSGTQVVVTNVDASYQGSKVVMIDFYDANFNLLGSMGSMDPSPV